VPLSSLLCRRPRRHVKVEQIGSARTILRAYRAAHWYLYFGTYTRNRLTTLWTYVIRFPWTKTMLANVLIELEQPILRLSWHSFIPRDVNHIIKQPPESVLLLFGLGFRLPISISSRSSFSS